VVARNQWINTANRNQTNAIEIHIHGRFQNPRVAPGSCRGGSRGWLGWLVTPPLVTPLARQPISCYYYACDLSYFNVVLCPSSSPDPLNVHSLRSLGFPKSTPSKNPRSANVLCPPGSSGGFFVLPADYIPTLVVWVRHESLRFVGGLVSRHDGKAHTRKENFSQWHAVKNAPFRCCKSKWRSLCIAIFTCLFCTDPASELHTCDSNDWYLDLIVGSAYARCALLLKAEVLSVNTKQWVTL